MFFGNKSKEKNFIQLLSENQCPNLEFGQLGCFFPVPLALEQVQNNCLCTLLQIMHNFKHRNQGSCKLLSENIAHLCLQHYKKWQDVLNNLFSQIRLTSWSSTICSLTPKGQKKSVFSVLLHNIALAIDIHCLCHHEGCGALLELLFFRRDTRLHTALLIIKQ